MRRAERRSFRDAVYFHNRLDLFFYFLFCFSCPAGICLFQLFRYCFAVKLHYRLLCIDRREKGEQHGNQ